MIKDQIHQIIKDIMIITIEQDHPIIIIIDKPHQIVPLLNVMIKKLLLISNVTSVIKNGILSILLQMKMLQNVMIVLQEFGLMNLEDKIIILETIMDIYMV